jgi:beta-galactosidase
MYFGVQYYPEHWPEARWAQDAEMMQRAGVNTVRMGEFAWSALEPQEGQYNFGWMDRALKLLQEHGIRTILCTCSRTPPPWVFHKYPEIRNVDRNGQPVPSDGRYAIGISHPRFISLSHAIDRKIIEHYAGHPAVVAWQIDNEVGSWNDCYCDDCLERFRSYLRQKYGSLEQLNESWGRDFWSFRIRDFADIPRPSVHPQLKLEYRRF